MRSTALCLCSILILLFAVTGPATAGQPRTHDGFFLRLSAGGGGAKTSEDFGSSTLEVSGAAGDVNFAVGGMISPNFAIHGTLFGWSLTDPEVKLTGYGSGEVNGDLSMSAVGVGFTYYFMPANFYISPSVGVGTLTLDLNGISDVESDPGIAMDLTLGKEWWVGNSWGLGVAGAVGFHSIPDNGTDDKLSGSNVAIRFTATYN